MTFFPNATAYSIRSRRLAHAQKLFDRASEVAKIGVWECALPSEELTWTDVVYDLFEIPRGTPVRREDVLPLYAPESLAELRLRRTRAIEQQTGFTLDAGIVTAKGNPRWIRLTATVECEDGQPVRIFGMKQDVTEEKLLIERTRYLAEVDPLTELFNRGVFQARLQEWSRPVTDDEPRALMLLDLDGFKLVNDSFGHAAGDECLKRVATRLRRTAADAELIARIGGDEFALLLDMDRSQVEEMARTIIREIQRPIRLKVGALQLGASIGIAFLDGSAKQTSEDLFVCADVALYSAKAEGKNTFQTFGAVPDLNVQMTGVDCGLDNAA